MHDPQVEYYLHDADERATSVKKSEMKPVRYTNLKGGKYVYELSLINSSTHDVQQTMTLSVVKEMAFYEQVWFYVVCIIIGLGIIAIVVSVYVGYKTKAFREKERENKIFIRDMCEAFAKTIDVKDTYTNGHSKRVALYTSMLTEELGYDESTVEKYYNIALLHDIGKIGVPMEVLNKPGKLTDEEFAIIKSHTTIGYNVLKDISIMPELATGAGAHHERPDGRGYPNGLKGEEIPRVAQIIAVADTFDAMYSNRPYRKRMNFEKVCSIINEVSGTQLEPDVVDAFMRLVEKGKFRAPNDHGGGSMDDINNIHKSFEKEAETASKNENAEAGKPADKETSPEEQTKKSEPETQSPA
jgi:energy-coupling factor transport system substrate-specific component